MKAAGESGADGEKKEGRKSRGESGGGGESARERGE